PRRAAAARAHRALRSVRHEHAGGNRSGGGGLPERSAGVRCIVCPAMGRVITFAGLPYREAATGVKRAPITGGDMKEMSAEVIRVARGAALTEDVPEGSDRYLFTLTGGATVSGRGRSLALAEETFAVIEEGTTLTVTNPNAGETTLISVRSEETRLNSSHGSLSYA